MPPRCPGQLAAFTVYTCACLSKTKANAANWCIHAAVSRSHNDNIRPMVHAIRCKRPPQWLVCTTLMQSSGLIVSVFAAAAALARKSCQKGTAASQASSCSHKQSCWVVQCSEHNQWRQWRYTIEFGGHRALGQRPARCLPLFAACSLGQIRQQCKCRSTRHKHCRFMI